MKTLMKDILTSARETKRTMKELWEDFLELRPYHVVVLVLLTLCSIIVPFSLSDWIKAAGARAETTVVSTPVDTTASTKSTQSVTTPEPSSAEENSKPDIDTMNSLEEIAEVYDVDVRDLRTLCQVAIGETVGDGEWSVLSVMNVVVNAANEWRDGDIYDEVFGFHDRYSCIDPDDNLPYCWVGEVTDEVIFREDCRWVIPLAVKVLLKEEPDPTWGALYYIAYKGLGLTLDEFLEKHHPSVFSVHGSQIFFKEWPESLNG